MLKEKEDVIRKAMVIFDAFLLSLVFILTFVIRRNFHLFYKLNLVPSARVVAEMSASFNDYLVALFLVVPIWCLMLYLNGMYQSMRTRSMLEILWIVIKASFLTTITFGTVVFFFKMDFVSRVFFALFISFSSSAVLLEKMVIFSIMHYVRRQGYNYRRIIVVGTGRRAVGFISKIKSHPEWGLRIAGLIDYEKIHTGKDIEGIRVIGSLEDIPHILHNYTNDEVVFIVPRAALSQIENSIYVCETEGIKATVAVDLFELKIARARQSELEDIPLITFETTFGEEWQLFVKRAFDIIISALGLIMLSPFFLMVAILIKITSTGPVFYRQKRIGLNGRRFILYKFRSMRKGAHEKLSELTDKNEMKGPVFKIKKDPRVTPIGRFLRKFSIDEFPQLYNVFVGHMSLVGPRPAIPKEVAQYEPWQRRRLSMRPGLTCLWQISGRNRVNFDEWMKLDLQYIDKWALLLDFKIIIKTIPVVIFGIGGY